MEKNTKKKSNKIKIIIGIFLIIIIGGAITSKDSDPKKVGESNSSTSSEHSSKKDEKTEFKVGDVVSFEGRELVVESIDRNYKTGNRFIKPKDGKEYVKVNVKIENKSSEKLSYNIFDFKMEDTNGAIESPTFVSTANAADNLSSGELAKGGKKIGSVVFEVPANSKLKMHYQPSFWSNKDVIINM